MAAAKILTLQDVVSDDLNYEICDVVENGIPPDPSKISNIATKIQPEDLSKWRDFVGKDTKALQILQFSLPDSVFRLTLETDSAKDLWDLLKEANEQAKLEKKSETLKPFFHRATEAQVNRVFVDIVSASANATPGLGRYPFKREVGAIASAALDGFKNKAKKMVVALVDMERAFVPPQHFIRLSLDF